MNVGVKIVLTMEVHCEMRFECVFGSDNHGSLLCDCLEVFGVGRDVVACCGLCLIGMEVLWLRVSGSYGDNVESRM